MVCFQSSRTLRFCALLPDKMTFQRTPSYALVAGALADGEVSAKGRQGRRITLWPARQVPVVRQACWLEDILCLLQDISRRLSIKQKT